MGSKNKSKRDEREALIRRDAEEYFIKRLGFDKATAYDLARRRRKWKEGK